MVKDGGVFYREKNRNPAYNILSYTWGRFRTDVPNYSNDAKGEAFQVDGIDWDIPPIDIKRFTRKQFKSVLRTIAGKCDYVWVDVACIRQGPKANVDEVNNQMAIFHHAKEAFIWLHSLDKDTLFASIKALVASIEQPLDPNNRPGLTAREKLILPLFEDMWFSSLWTLQQALLRKDALMLPVSGEKITVAYNENQNNLTLDFLIDICNTIERQQDAIKVSSTFKISGDFEQCGLNSLGSNNPLVLLRAARRRQCTLNRDRIIGIMQVFGMKLDKLGEQFQEGELLEKLSFWINSRNPALAQAFIHTCPEEGTKGKSWQARLGTYTPDKTLRGGGARKGIDETMHIPEDMYGAQEVPCQLKGSILFRSSTHSFKDTASHSKACSACGNTRRRDPPSQALSTRRTAYTNSFACSV